MPKKSNKLYYPLFAKSNLNASYLLCGPLTHYFLCNRVAITIVITQVPSRTHMDSKMRSVGLDQPWLTIVQMEAAHVSYITLMTNLLIKAILLEMLLMTMRGRLTKVAQSLRHGSQLLHVAMIVIVLMEMLVTAKKNALIVHAEEARPKYVMTILNALMILAQLLVVNA